MSSRASEFVDTLRSGLNRLEDPTPPFSFEVGWLSNYDQLFAGEFERKTEIATLLDHAVRYGRLVLTGRGGGAKTIILNRVAKLAAERGMVPAVIGLKGWTAPDYVVWDRLQDSGERLRYLFERFALVRVGVADLDALRPSAWRIVLVDGLNEVDSRTGQQIIDALDDYARYAISTSVIVTDRLVRREFLRPDRWVLATVLPLAIDEVRSVLTQAKGDSRVFDAASGGVQTLLRSPFFLNQFLKEGLIEGTFADQMEAYFTRHALNHGQIALASRAAFIVYRNSTRTFSLAEFREVAGTDVAAALQTAGALVVKEHEAFFDHHLKHDYLASRFVASDPRMWGRDVFNRVTFHASSFETIVMLMGRMETKEQADVLLRRLYDWNVYAAGYALAEGRHVHVTQEMYAVVLAMLAERRWDLISATSLRARDTLALFDNELATKFLNTNSVEDVFHVLDEIDAQTDWFNRWRTLYSRPVRSTISDSELNLLSNDDSVLGWTTSNVLRRSRLSTKQQQKLRSEFSEASDVVKWRIVHVFGTIPNQPNAKLLRDALRNGTTEVRFGATRSLVEMAVLSTDKLCQWILRGLRTEIPAMKFHRSIIEEFRRAIFVRKDRARSGWGKMVVPIILELEARSSGAEEREGWDKVAHQLVSEYEL